MQTRFKLALLLLLSPAVLHAQTTINVPGDQPTIQAAIDAANPGDTVTVAKNTYYENLDFKGKAIALDGGNNGVIIDGSGKGPVITIQGASANGAIVEGGFAIQNGGKPQSAGGPQGAIYISGASVKLLYIQMNNSFCAGIVSINGNPYIYDVGIHGTVTTGCAPAEGLGSAIVISGSSSDATTPPTLIELSALADNQASVGYSSDKGGGAGINITNGGTVYIEQNQLSNNTTTGYGGAVYIAQTPSVYFIGNEVFSNKGLSGGIDLVVPGSSVGPLTGLLANNTMVDNTATTTNSGSDIYIGGNLAQYALVNNIVVGYQSGEIAVNCGTIYAGQTLTPLVFDHNDFYSLSGSGGTPVGGACPNPAGQHGNISQDPLFANVTTSDLAAGNPNFQLDATSPAVDTGNNSVQVRTQTDIVDQERVLGGGASGYSIIDMGAYESVFSFASERPTSIQLSSSTYTPATGSSIVLTATLTTDLTVPTGNVTFYEDGSFVGTGTINASGVAVYTVTNLAAGLHTFYAGYAGQSSGVYYASAATSVYFYLNVVTGAGLVTNTVLSSSQNPSNHGDPVTFTANVTSSSGTPTGTVTFTSGGVTLGSNIAVDGSGNAQVTTSTLPVGNDVITATYTPTGTFNTSNGSITQVVNGLPTTATLSATPATITYGDTVTLNATIAPTTPPGSGTPTGTVTFTVDGTPSPAQNLIAGAATLQLATLNAGPHTFGCTYSGDTTYNGATCNAASVTVNQVATSLTLTSNPNPSPALTLVTFTATLLTSPGGKPIAGATVTIGETGNTITATTNASGVATATLLFNAGSQTINANFTATTNDTAASAQVIQMVNPNPTTITLIAAPNPGYQNQPVTIVATVAATAGTASPFGTVTLYDGGTPIATQPTPAENLATTLTSVTFTTSALAPGTHSLTASYTPNNNFLASSTAAPPLQLTILPQTFTFTSSAPSITIETEHHGTLALQLGSVGGFTGTIYLSCGPDVPKWVTCTLPGQVFLPSNGQTPVTLALDTDAIQDFKSATMPNSRPGSHGGLITLAALLPLALFGFKRRHRRLPAALLAAILLAALATLAGCSGQQPGHTTPGTYTIDLTAQGTAAGASVPTMQTLSITLIVTP